MKSKFTPGPWKRSNKNLGYVHAPDGDNHIVRIAEVGSFSDRELLRFNKDRWNADLKLIAAAPEMYEALEAVEEYFEVKRRPDIHQDPGTLISLLAESAKRLVTEALKKARGEK